MRRELALGDQGKYGKRRDGQLYLLLCSETLRYPAT